MTAPGPSGASPCGCGVVAPLCPSASAQADGAVVIGIVRGTAEAPLVAYLEAPVPITEEILAATAPVPVNQVLRTAAPCAGDACGHYDGRDCTLVTRLVAALDPAVGRPPPCAIRPSCRWWRQEGKAACLRCPLVATESRGAGEAFATAARAPV
jgi:hypothetical protein